jgi:hypothetical protein
VEIGYIKGSFGAHQEAKVIPPNKIDSNNASKKGPTERERERERECCKDFVPKSD